MRVKIGNPDLSGEERTYLTADYTSGANITVRSNENAQNGRFAILGEPGQERTEDARITGTSSYDTIATTAGFTYPHSKSTIVYIYIYDKISFERKPSAGSFAEISGSPFAIEWDNEDKETMITVPSGASTDTYRWRLYNSATGTYSDYSDELPGTGIARNKLGYVLQQVRRNPLTQGIADDTLIDYANDYQSLVYERMPKAWWFTKEGTQVATAADDYTYSISDNWSDFLAMKFMLFRFISGSIDETYPLTYSPLNEFYNLKADSQQTSDDHVKVWTLLPPDSSSAKGYIGLHPTPDTTACRLKPVYEFALTDLDSFGDTLVVPDSKGYIDYILYRICDDIKNDAGNAEKYNARVKASLDRLKGTRTKRQLGQPELFRYRGQKGWSRMYGEGGKSSSSNYRELYW